MAAAFVKLVCLCGLVNWWT